VVAGCAAPPPQVVYVPFPPSADAAPAPTVAPTPEAARSQAELEEERTWRFCIRTASEVDRYVYGRDTGIDYTLARDWGLEQEAEYVQGRRREARTAADHERFDRLDRFAAMMAQQMVQQVYQRPYGNAAQERALWIENCMTPWHSAGTHGVTGAMISHEPRSSGLAVGNATPSIQGAISQATS
jgi:hypothetical protein